MSVIRIKASVIRISLIVFFAVFSFVIISTVSHADEAIAEKGQKLFQDKGCVACHSIGKGKITGPDLLGVTQRRDEEWLKKWLKSPDTMVMTDPVAKELLKEFLVPMPNQGLNDEEIEVLIEFFEYNDSQKK